MGMWDWTTVAAVSSIKIARIHLYKVKWNQYFMQEIVYFLYGYCLYLKEDTDDGKYTHA